MPMMSEGKRSFQDLPREPGVVLLPTPTLGLGVFMLHSGLCREGGKFTGAVGNYMFPELHKVKKESVSDCLLKSIKKYVKSEFDEEQAKLYNSRSLRKGAMTENRADRDLSTHKRNMLAADILLLIRTAMLRVMLK